MKVASSYWTQELDRMSGRADTAQVSRLHGYTIEPARFG
jgi:hypothetical protein